MAESMEVAASHSVDPAGWLTLPRLDEEFGLGRSFWRRRVLRGELPAIRAPRGWVYVQRRDAERFLARIRVRPTEGAD